MVAKEGASLLARLMKSHPMTTNCLVMSSLSGLAELSQQGMSLMMDKSKKKKLVDWASVGRYTLLGGVLYAPVLTVWYRWLDKRMPGTGATIVAKKVAVDALVLDVPFYTAFYVAMCTLEGKSRAVTVQEVKEKLLPTVGFIVALWTPAQAINFRLVPPRWRVVYIAAVTFLEINILAVLKKRPVGEIEAF